MTRAIAANLVVSACLVVGQPGASAPAFEAASIKPNTSGDGSSYIRPSAGRLSVTNTTLRSLLTFAYQIREFQISGGAGWIDSAHYDIEAKAEGNAGADQMRLMLQTLLRDRFKLTLHRETKELPIYLLTVAKGGFKLQPLKEGDCVTFDPNNTARDPGRKQSDFCGNMVVGRGSLDAIKARMTDLTPLFSFILGRTVVDQTGITGAFSVHLKFAPDDAPPADAAGPSIFTAVQEQLGLKLESGKGPVEILVIDSVEKPSEN